MLSNLNSDSDKKSRLVDLLLECPTLKDKNNRDLLIKELPPYITNNIENNEQPRMHVLNIVNTCNNYKDGVEHLFKVLKNLDGNTIPFKKMVDEFIVPETKETVKSMKPNQACDEWKKVRELVPDSPEVSSEIQRLAENGIQALKGDLLKLCVNLPQKNKEFERLVNNLSSRLNENEQKELNNFFEKFFESVQFLCRNLDEVEQLEKAKKGNIEAAINAMDQSKSNS